MTAVLVTHDLREAVRVATRVAVMRGGRVVMESAADTLVQDATGYTAELVEKSGVAP